VAGAVVMAGAVVVAGAVAGTEAVSPPADDAALEHAARSTATAVATPTRPSVLSTRAMLARAASCGGAAP